jgi:hypothetical protein
LAGQAVESLSNQLNSWGFVLGHYLKTLRIDGGIFPYIQMGYFAHSLDKWCFSSFPRAAWERGATSFVDMRSKHFLRIVLY